MLRALPTAARAQLRQDAAAAAAVFARLWDAPLSDDDFDTLVGVLILEDHRADVPAWPPYAPDVDAPAWRTWLEQRCGRLRSPVLEAAASPPVRELLLAARAELSPDARALSGLLLSRVRFGSRFPSRALRQRVERLALRIAASELRGAWCVRGFPVSDIPAMLIRA